jgi:hypothetical protein
LWATATRLRISEDELRQASDETTSGDGVAATVERASDPAEPDTSGRLRNGIRWAIAGVALCAVGGLIAVIDPIRTAPPAACALLATALVLFYRARLVQRPTAEQPASGIDGDAHRRLERLADNQRVCDQRWTDVAGDIDVTRALEHHEEIVAASAALDESSTEPSDLDDSTADLAHGIEARFAALHHLGELGESFPLILDEPFDGLEEGVTTALLELVGRRAGDPQVVILTEDDRIASWGRLEALTGRLAVIEETVDEPAAPGLRGAPRA